MNQYDCHSLIILQVTLCRHSWNNSIIHTCTCTMWLDKKRNYSASTLLSEGHFLDLTWDCLFCCWYMYIYIFCFPPVSSCRVRTLFQAKVQGLFKDFPGSYFEISRTFLHTNLPTAKQNVCFESYASGINTCTCRNVSKQELENM